MAFPTTRIPPTKPHFFKPLLPNFLDELLIPLSFFKYLNGQKCEGHALLRTCLGNWRVKINSQRIMKEGWTNFAKENGLQVGDFLVFRHEGDMVFDVMVFDRSACEREYKLSSLNNADNLYPKIPKVEQESSDLTQPQDASVFAASSTLCKAMMNVKDKVEDYITSVYDMMVQSTDPSGLKRTTLKLDHPYMELTLKPYSVAGSYIYIPTDFAWSNGLSNRKCEMIVKDAQRSWQVGLRHKSDGRVYIGNGWRSFREAKDLKEGDSFALELVENGKKPIMNFHWVDGKDEGKEKTRAWPC